MIAITTTMIMVGPLLMLSATTATINTNIINNLCRPTKENLKTNNCPWKWKNYPHLARC